MVTGWSQNLGDLIARRLSLGSDQTFAPLQYFQGFIQCIFEHKYMRRYIYTEIPKAVHN